MLATSSTTHLPTFYAFLKVVTQAEPPVFPLCNSKTALGYWESKLNELSDKKHCVVGVSDLSKAPTVTVPQGQKCSLFTEALIFFLLSLQA